MQRYKRVARDPSLCYHFLNRRTKLYLSIEELKDITLDEVWCEICGLDGVDADAAFWMCLDCGDLFCDDDVGDFPHGHINDHARDSCHPVAIRSDRLDRVCCFACQGYRPIGAKVEYVEKERTEHNVKESKPKSNVLVTNFVKRMPNYGNTCFLNSILQNLLALRKLVMAVSRLNPVGNIARNLQILIEGDHSDEVVLDPLPLHQSIFAATQEFKIGVQHDSHEFLQCLINALEREDPDVGDQTFRGRLSSTLSCAQCGKKRVQDEPFLDLSLEVPSRILPMKTGNTPKAVDASSSRDKRDDEDTVIMDDKGSSRKDKSPGPSGRVKLSSLRPVNYLKILPSDDWPEDRPLVKQCLRRYPPASSVTTAQMISAKKPKSKWLEEHQNMSAGEEEAGEKKSSGSEMVCDSKVSTGESCKAGADRQPTFKIPKVMSYGGSGAAHEDETGAARKDEASTAHKVGNCIVDHWAGFVTVEKCLKLFTRVENLPESKCERCGHGQCKRLLIRKAPPILAIHLKRFCHTGSGVQMKVKGPLGFRKELNLTPYMDPEHVGNQVLKYRLRGIVEHLGDSMTFGHFVAFVRREDSRVGRSYDPDAETWFGVSDTQVHYVDSRQVVKREAYILFYERHPR